MRLFKWVGGLAITAVAIPVGAIFLFHLAHNEPPPTYFNLLFWIDPAAPECEAEYTANNPPLLNPDYSDVCHVVPYDPGPPRPEQPADIPPPVP